MEEFLHSDKGRFLVPAGRLIAGYVVPPYSIDQFDRRFVFSYNLYHLIAVRHATVHELDEWTKSQVVFSSMMPRYLPVLPNTSCKDNQAIDTTYIASQNMAPIIKGERQYRTSCVSYCSIQRGSRFRPWQHAIVNGYEE